jgi:hypothetical protein
MGIAFWFGTNLVIDGTTSPGTVFACFWSVVIGAMQVGQALPQIATLVGARIAAGEIFSVIDRVIIIFSFKLISILEARTRLFKHDWSEAD